MSVFLEYHSFYVTQFVASGRDSGKFVDDDQVPKMEFFSKMLFTILLALDVLYILACILLLVGVAAVKHIMMMPWLIWVRIITGLASGEINEMIQTFCALISHLTIVLAFMISLADYASVAVFLCSSPSLVIISYLWLMVYSCSQLIKKEEIRLEVSLVETTLMFPLSARGPKAETVGGQSASHSSISSLKENITRAIRGTPPPPYEAVTTKSSPRDATTSRRKSGSGTSCSSLVELLHFKSSTDQSERSSQSNSRRSSEGQTSTKPASPVTLLRKRSSGEKTSSDLLMFPASQKQSPDHTLRSSQSQSQLCTAHREPLRLPKSHSSMISTFSPDLVIQFSKAQPGTTPDQAKPQTLLIDETSELSDETSSMSSTSLSFSDNKIV